MDHPDDLRYSADHEWARLDGATVRIGITDYAQDALGDIVYIELPEVGASLAAHDKISEVESTKSVSDIFAPVGGTIVEINDALADHPEQLNADPYGEGWICTIELADPSEYETMLAAAAYRELIAE
jgi:glycine cleavage system H protein